MGREARRPERPGPGARRRGDPTPDPAGRIERPGQGRERGTRPLQPAGQRAPGPTQRTQAEEAPPRRRTARKAPAGTEAPRVPTDDVRPDGRQGTRPNRRDPTLAGGGQETREVARGERGRPEDERRAKVGARPRGRRRREERGGTHLRAVQERREALDRGPPHAPEVRIPLTTPRFGLHLPRHLRVAATNLSGEYT